MPLVQKLGLGILCVAADLALSTTLYPMYSTSTLLGLRKYIRSGWLSIQYWHLSYLRLRTGPKTYAGRVSNDDSRQDIKQLHMSPTSTCISLGYGSLACLGGPLVEPLV